MAKVLQLHPADQQPPPLSRKACPCAGLTASQADPDGMAEDFEPPRHPALIIQSDGEKVLFFRACSETPETVAVADFLELFEPEVLFLSREAEAQGGSKDPDLTPHGAKRFGLSWFFPELLRYKKTWRDILLGSLSLQIVGLTTPLCTQVIIDKVVAHQTHSTLAVVAAALVIFAVFSAVMTWVRQYLVLHTGNRIDAVLGSQVFRHLLRLPLPYFENRPTGVLVARLRGVEQVREFLSGAAFSALLDFPFLFIALAVMLCYSWQLTLIAVFLMGVICIMSAVVTPIFRQRLDKQFQTGARAQAFLTEYVSGMNTVKSLQMEPQLEQRYGGLIAAYLSSGFATRQVANTYNSAANTVEQVMSMAILIVGALLVMQNDGFTIGMLVAFQMFTSRMSQPMLRLVGLWQEFQQTQVSIARLADIMDMPAEPHALTPMRESSGVGKIELKEVSFRYSEEYPYLYRGLDLTLEPGKLTVIMGPSGCGKSTLAKLLMGFYMPSEGQILLDGRDIRRMAANELRRNYGVVPQETMLFSGSIYDNLIAAHPHADFKDIVQACKFAEIHDVIEKLPQGYQTELGEHGVGLSGGQRQRLAIARALLKRPKILIFDEATSNLDAETAEHFARTINRIKGKTTMLFIAHMLPKALQVDEVVRFGGPESMSQGSGAGGTQAAGPGKDGA
ncbi:MAG TPA: peptidase domain-containing ABC transporter [Humidesulfovibrio sp.]|uniref:peptidase domain-containing ABC transporter n=1 Tax=Humidesulfovibrio sp. TaxID=2910988 RepID=UPI002BE0F326|nr:peptidase domain-containing ABC transporter [Humidesulfovibrio sp.]HWR04554.1 peptidase domain-containing ABC transporter [Humidesulfovibrio sp.]